MHSTGRIVRSGKCDIMKPNRFKDLIREGTMPVGHMLVEFNSHGTARILEAANVDFAVIDMEHGAFTVRDVANMVSWFSATTVVAFVRIPPRDYHLISRVMDAGAQGVVVANVTDADQAHQIVNAVKYAPMGKRGFSCGGATSDYRMGDPQEYASESNEQTVAICMIESPEGVENVDKIAATPGVDALWVGHWDLSQYMGIPGDFACDAFRNAVKRIIESARKHSLPTVIQPGNMEQLRQFKDLGFHIFSWGGDFYVYRQALTEAVSLVKEELAR